MRWRFAGGPLSAIPTERASALKQNGRQTGVAGGRRAKRGALATASLSASRLKPARAPPGATSRTDGEGVELAPCRLVALEGRGEAGPRPGGAERSLPRGGAWPLIVNEASPARRRGASARTARPAAAASRSATVPTRVSRDNSVAVLALSWSAPACLSLHLSSCALLTLSRLSSRRHSLLPVAKLKRRIARRTPSSSAPSQQTARAGSLPTRRRTRPLTEPSSRPG